MNTNGTNNESVSPAQVERLCTSADGVFDAEKLARVGDLRMHQSDFRIFFIDPGRRESSP